MNIEEIQKFLDTKISKDKNYVRISFKKRNSIYGLFVTGHKDYDDLKSKNFWRIVPQSQFEAYGSSKNVGLAKIFHGSEFSRLTPYGESFEED